MTAIDGTGLHALENFCDRVKRSGRTLILCGARRQPAQFLQQAEFIEHIGSENICPHVEGALARAKEVFECFSGVGEEAARSLVKARM
jgi:SulP family sulfate permease